MRAFGVFAAGALLAAAGASPNAESKPAAENATASGQIAFTRTGSHGRDIGELYVMNADGTAQRNLTNRRTDDSLPVWSPDGRKLAFVSRHGSTSEIHVANSDGSGLGRVTRGGWSDRPVWSPDGRRIAFIREFLDPPRNPYGYRTSEIFVTNADGSGERRLTRNRLHEFALDWSRTGKLAFVRAPRLEPQYWTGSEIFVMNPDGSRVRQLTRNRLREDGLSWAPDGRTIAFIRWNASLDTSSIFVMNARGTGLRMLTRPSAFYAGMAEPPTALVWSPNGKKLAINWGPRLGIWVMNADGSVLRRVATDRPGYPSWSPDGRAVAFHRHPAIYLVNADGSGQRRLVPRPGRPLFSLGENWSPVWSPRP